jgi:hypothetical protein
MSQKLRNSMIVLGVGLAALLFFGTPAQALVVGWNLDIHQGKNLPAGQLPNDFHIGGQLESGLPDGSNPPLFVSQVNWQVNGPGGPPVPGGIKFNNFGQTITVTPTPGAPWYNFTADWTNPSVAEVPFSTWMHFGLQFDETCHNIGYWLQGWWTKDGIQDPPFSPIYGFEVRDGILEPEPQKIRIQNASGVTTTLQSMDLMVLNPGETFQLQNLTTDFFDTHPEWNGRWVHVPSALLPTTFPSGSPANDSFFDVFLTQVPGLGALPANGMLLAREFSSYTGGSVDNFWNYEMHGAHMPEPGAIVLIGTGLLAMGLGYIWRRRK